MSEIPNILADRYATEPMKAIWSSEGKVILERELWIAVMKAQAELGLEIPDGLIVDDLDIDLVLTSPYFFC